MEILRIGANEKNEHKNDDTTHHQAFLRLSAEFSTERTSILLILRGFFRSWVGVFTHLPSGRLVRRSLGGDAPSSDCQLRKERLTPSRWIKLPLRPGTTHPTFDGTRICPKGHCVQFVSFNLHLHAGIAQLLDECLGKLTDIRLLDALPVC